MPNKIDGSGFAFDPGFLIPGGEGFENPIVDASGKILWLGDKINGLIGDKIDDAASRIIPLQAKALAPIVNAVADSAAKYSDLSSKANQDAANKAGAAFEGAANAMVGFPPLPAKPPPPAPPPMAPASAGIAPPAPLPIAPQPANIPPAAPLPIAPQPIAGVNPLADCTEKIFDWDSFAGRIKLPVGYDASKVDTCGNPPAYSWPCNNPGVNPIPDVDWRAVFSVPVLAAFQWAVPLFRNSFIQNLCQYNHCVNNYNELVEASISYVSSVMQKYYDDCFKSPLEAAKSAVAGAAGAVAGAVASGSTPDIRTLPDGSKVDCSTRTGTGVFDPSNPGSGVFQLTPEQQAACSQPLPKSADKCACCCCQHAAEDSCPTGSVRLDGKCKSLEELAPKRWITYHSKEKESCTTLKASDLKPSGDYVPVAGGETAQDSQIAAAFACKPKLMSTVPPSALEMYALGATQCRPDAYMATGLEKWGVEGKFMATLTSMLGMPPNAKPFYESQDNTDIFNFFANVILGSANIATSSFVGGAARTFEQIFETMNPQRTMSFAGFSGLAVGDFIQKYIGGPFDYITTPLRYIMQGSNPVKFPSAAQANAAFFANAIDSRLHKNWVEINGHCWEPWQAVIAAERSKPMPGELIQLVRRGIISEAQFDAGMRQLGYLEQQVRSDLRKLGEFIPPYTDLTRFMVRDVEDEAIVNKFQLDTQFTDKFRGKTKEWATAQGITDEAMRNVWRAHWIIPAPGQLFEMYHRLSRLPDGNPNKLTIEEVKTALIYQDILPFWVDKFLAISHRRLRLVDIRRAFEIGSITRERVKEFYRELGYTEENAEILTKFAEKKKLRDGTKHSAVARYAAGEINTADMMTELADDGFTPADIDKIKAKAIRRFYFKSTAKCMVAVRKRMLLHELTPDEARAEIVRRGLDGEQASMIAAGWECESKAMGRELSSAQLISMFADGLITEEELLKRLQRAGYSEGDAIRIAVQATKNIGLRLAKDDAKRQKEQEKNLAKQMRENDKLQKDIERRAKNAAAAAKTASAAKVRREKQLSSSSRMLASKCGYDTLHAYDLLASCVPNLRSKFGFTPDEAMQVITVAVEEDFDCDMVDICSRINQLAEIMRASDGVLGE